MTKWLGSQGKETELKEQQSHEIKGIGKGKRRKKKERKVKR